ncbi:pyruvate dehydrogenase (acetyl-transferring) E1 component subunit alpha, partial [Candidatus Aerophobetes bacterium]|nr:pyruvate dehydrogenase (acetyl-transferring) E1 component subunit alpha [Candidatus Aerophobetes bacterium]
CKTYRFRGHYVGEGSRGLTYRSEEEIKKWQKKCPIKIFKDYLTGEKIYTKSFLEGIDEQIDTEIQEAVRFAEESPYPEAEDALKDLFVEEIIR